MKWNIQLSLNCPPFKKDTLILKWRYEKLRVWWIPVIPALRKQKEEGCQIWGHLGYIVRSYLKEKTKKDKQNFKI